MNLKLEGLYQSFPTLNTVSLHIVNNFGFLCGSGRVVWSQNSLLYFLLCISILLVFSFGMHS